MGVWGRKSHSYFEGVELGLFLSSALNLRDKTFINLYLLCGVVLCQLNVYLSNSPPSKWSYFVQVYIYIYYFVPILSVIKK